jgi:hypothetical protein
MFAINECVSNLGKKYRIMKINQLILLFREISAGYFENHIKYSYTLCGHNAEF